MAVTIAKDGAQSQNPFPGTVQLEDSSGSAIYLSPKPTRDPNDPLNWKVRRKVQQTIILSLYTVLIDSCLTVATPLWSLMTKEDPKAFSTVNLNNSYASGAAALSVGCILFVPFSLRFGRRPVYNLTAAIIVGMASWSAVMTTSGELFATQVVMTAVGVVNQTLFQISIADMFFVHQRGTLNGIYFANTMLGNFVAPILAGYIAESQGWRWSYWYIAIFSGAITVVMFFFLEETKYNNMPDETPNKVEQCISAEKSDAVIDTVLAEHPTVEQHQEYIDCTIPTLSYWTRMSPFRTQAPRAESYKFTRHFWQPFVMIAMIPAVTFAAILYGFGFSCLQIVLVTQAVLYPEAPYNFGPVGVGNVIVAPLIGGMLGCFVGGWMSDWVIMRLAKKKGGIYEPEMRYYIFIIPALALPAGLWLYGLTISKGMPWIINCVGAALVMFSGSACASIAVTYLQDAYQEIVGDCLMGVSFVRNTIATALIFAIPPWMDGMGVYNMFILLGCLGVLVNSPFVLFLIWGKKWRGMTAERYYFYAERQAKGRET